MLDQEVQRQKCGHYRAADVDRDDGPRPLLDHGDDVAHAEVGDDAPRDHLLTREMGDRDIDIAAKEGQEQHGKQIAAVNANLRVGILEDAHLDQGEQ